MRILIVYAHPEPRSFVGALRDEACVTLARAGHEVVVSDLYAMQFDAAGGPQDFRELASPDRFGYQREQMKAAADDGFVPDVGREIAKVRDAELLLFVFPLWWFGLPAILMLHFVGMDVLPPFIAYGAARVDDAPRAGYLAEWRERLEAVAGARPIVFDAANPAWLG